MKRTSKWDVTVNWVAESEKNASPLLMSAFDCRIAIARCVSIFKWVKSRKSMWTETFYLTSKGWRTLISRHSNVTEWNRRGKVVKWTIKSQFLFLLLIPAFHRCRSSGMIVWLPVEHVTMFRSTPTPLPIHSFDLFTTCENALISSKPS